MQTRAATGVQAAPVSRSVWGRQALRWAAGRARWGFAHPENGSLDLGDVRVLDECAGQTIWARGSAPCATVGWRPHGRSAGILRLMGPTTGSVPPGGCRKVLYHLPPPTPKNRKFPVIFIEIACFWTLKYPVFWASIRLGEWTHKGVGGTKGLTQKLTLGLILVRSRRDAAAPVSHLN